MNPGDAPIEWTEDGRPRSSLYGDAYFGADDGLAESRAVFLEGCRLPAAWAGRRSFTVAELGFGTGLNILALLDLWRREGPPGGRLHLFSVEAHLMPREDAARALSAWPELATLAAPLLAQWPGKRRGFHRIDLPESRASLDLALMEAGEALSRWEGRADAWFLDGFAPALNPDMWRDEVLQAVAARSAPGARAATFTVAGQVRRGLAAAGFEASRAPGHGRKRERLEAVLPGQVTTPGPAGPAAVIGAGIAGAAVRRALLALGVEVVQFEAEAPGAGASGNPAGLVTPRLDAGLGPAWAPSPGWRPRPTCGPWTSTTPCPGQCSPAGCSSWRRARGTRTGSPGSPARTSFRRGRCDVWTRPPPRNGWGSRRTGQA